MLSDTRIRALVERIELQSKRSGGEGWGVDMIVKLRDGRSIEDALESFIGCPESPFSADRLRRKFMALTEGARVDRGALFDKLESILLLDNVGELWS